MSINNAGLEMVKRFEGLCLVATKCAAGVWTIGYGHTGTLNGKKVDKNTTITKSAAEKLLKEDLERFWKDVCNTKYVPLYKQMNDNQLSALCSFAFNCGTNNLKTLCANRSIKEIGEAMPLYNKAAGKVLAGLTSRRLTEKALYFSETKQTTKTSSVDLSTLRRGDEGQQVRVLQRLMGGVTADGKFGAATEAAVVAWQNSYKLTADGIVGPKTWEKLLS